MQKIVHCLSQGLLLGLGLYKCHSMGLLPTHESDWLAFSQQPIVRDTPVFALIPRADQVRLLRIRSQQKSRTSRSTDGGIDNRTVHATFM